MLFDVGGTDITQACLQVMVDLRST